MVLEFIQVDLATRIATQRRRNLSVPIASASWAFVPVVRRRRRCDDFRNCASGVKSAALKSGDEVREDFDRADPLGVFL